MRGFEIQCKEYCSTQRFPSRAAWIYRLEKCESVNGVDFVEKYLFLPIFIYRYCREMGGVAARRLRSRIERFSR